ncbi:MAG: response regulator [Candidatus Omnitrophica bacterium]|nr:response regulator [Candidatus Omnitrophota bacterium]
MDKPDPVVKYRKSGVGMALTGLKQKKVLIAEDDQSSQYLMKLVMEDLGFSAVIVSNGQEVLDRLKAEAFDLIIMDIRMPILDGYRATSMIRHELKLDLPIIALTAHAMDWVPARCYAAGMNGFISKPITDLKKLKDAILEQLNRPEPPQA